MFSSKSSTQYPQTGSLLLNGKVGLFFVQVSYCINVSSIILVQGRHGYLDGKTSPEAINLLITLEKA